MAVIREVHASFEAQTMRQREIIATAPPFLTAGATAFFGSLGQWFLSAGSADSNQTIVLPDPSLNLSLPYPEDASVVILSGACLPQTYLQARRELDVRRCIGG